ncbi:MAG: hypothetical protein JW801_16845 [Bacteroidales bacterium]|nr:hypothetical protein [Bacteroidales bacterium]
MLEKIDKVVIGLIVGLALPMILYYVFYAESIKAYADIYFITKSGEIKMALPAALPVLLTRIIFPNALIFFLFIWLNRLKVAKGLLIITAVLTAFLVILEVAY